MSDFTKFYTFPQDLLTGLHDFENDTFHIALTNVQPDAATDLDFPSITEIDAQHGYTSGGQEIMLSLNLTDDGKSVVAGMPIVFTASGGSFGPFQYAVLYNYTQSDQRLVCYWDYGSSIELLDSETLTIATDAINGVFSIV